MRHLRVAGDNIVLDELSDEELAAGTRNGSKIHFAALVRRHQAAVTGYADRFLGDHALALDVTQEVFLTFWQGRDRYHSKGKLRAYLFQIAFHRCHKVARSRTRQRRRAERARDAAPPPSQDNPEARSAASEETRALHEHLRALRTTTRHVIVMRYASEMSLKEIAQTLGKPLNTIKSHVYRGLEKLGDLFSGDVP